MSAFSAGLCGIIFLLILLFSRMPIGFAMGIAGVVGTFYLIGVDAALTVLGLVPYRTAASFTLAVLPLFVLMGALASASGLCQDVYAAIYKLVGHFPGGLAMATVGGCAGFAAVSGSSVATAATLGSVALPEMRRYRYDPALATGCLAAGGTIGILIPPSIGFIIYALLTEQSIGKLFAAGIIPGSLQVLFYIVTIYVLCRRNMALGPPGEVTSFKAKISSLKGIWGALFIFLLVMGGIYFGIFTPTEAGAIGVFGVFLFGFIRKRFNFQNIIKSGLETTRTTGMIFGLLIGAMIFSYFLAVSEFPFELARIVGDLEINKYLILALIFVIYMILGCVVESMAMVILTVPIFFPIIIGMGFDPIWFGVIVVISIEIALITPPVGLNVFIIKGIANDVHMYTIFRGTIPFLLCNVLLLLVLVLFPQLTLFLPKLIS